MRRQTHKSFRQNRQSCRFERQESGAYQSTWNPPTLVAWSSQDIDAYCIAASCLNVPPKIQTEAFEILQFRKHDRANINCQRERTYQLDGRTVAKNRKKRMDQKDNSLAEWFADMVKVHGIPEAERMRSRLSVKKSTRHYNTKGRIMPGTVFQYCGKRYVMTGQISGGLYYRAYECGDQNFPSRKVRIIHKNRGLVYV